MLQVVRDFGDDVIGWVDVARVEVPSGTKRATTMREAAKAWGGEVPPEGVPVRLIRAEDAEVKTLRPKAPEPPQLEIV